LSHGQTAELKAELNDIAAELAAVPRVLCHRDYHTANLMLDKAGNVRVVGSPGCADGAGELRFGFALARSATGDAFAGEVRAHRLFFLTRVAATGWRQSIRMTSARNSD
jgi:hypothetical protein